MTGILIGGGSSRKGIVKRTPREEMALRVRMLYGRHITDVLSQAQKELGVEGAQAVYPLDMSDNTPERYLRPRARAYDTPPLVDDLSEDLARLIGDMSARTLVARYATVGARPMPTRMVTVCREVLRLRLWCNYAGTLIRENERTRRPCLEAVTPDDLEVDYDGSGDPLAPIRVRHCRLREIDGELVEVWDVYDLSDLDAPSFRVLHDDRDVTEKALGMDLPDPYWHPDWRYAPSEAFPEGRPFHRIVISGDPRQPYLGIALVEGAMRLSVGLTHFWAGVRDAGHPGIHALGLKRRGQSSDSGTVGGYAGPTVVTEWEHVDPQRPGELVQLGPGFDPEVVARALQIYESRTMSAVGRAVDAERTGGEPLQQEADALLDIEKATYPECRGHDALVFRRLAALHNRFSERTEGMEPANLPEAPLATLYRGEITEALAPTEGGDDG